MGGRYGKAPIELPDIALPQEAIRCLYREDPPLVQLRNQFRESGFRDQERKITHALKSREEGEHWTRCAHGSPFGCAELVLNVVIFKYTTGYGLHPGQALWLFVLLWLVCALAYWLFIRFAKHGGLYLIPTRAGTGATALRHPKLQRIKPHRLSLPRLCDYPTTTMARVVAYARALFRERPPRLRQRYTLLRAAIWFSTISSLNIGFRNIAPGRWIRLLTKREYDIKARGWPRVVSGLQSIMSFCLFVLWVLTYFGRPFG